jgi:hypothetical protein
MSEIPTQFAHKVKPRIIAKLTMVDKIRKIVN